MNIVLTLVFAVVMLFFMIFPAIKITELLFENFNFSSKIYNSIVLAITVLLSLFIGIFLKFF